MAQRIQVLLEDDLTGGTASETIRFGLDGVSYEIDLNEENAKKLRDSVSAFVEHGRKAGSGNRQRRGRGASTQERSAEVRAWAKSHGIDVSDRGRIPADVVAKYEAAH